MYHKITMAGRLGRDPDMRYMPDGTAVTNFSLAVDDGFGENKSTIWMRVSVWGKRAEVANQYLNVGSKVLVEGRLRADKQSGAPKLFTRQDGSVGSSFEMTASDFAFLGGRSDGEGMVPTPSSEGASGEPPVEEDDIPF